MIVLINSTFAELILHLKIISSSNAPYAYPKDKSLWLKFVILRFHFPMKKNILFVILHSLVVTNSINLKTYLMQQLNATFEYILSTESFSVPLWIWTKEIYNNPLDDYLYSLCKKLCIYIYMYIYLSFSSFILFHLEIFQYLNSRFARC